MLRLFAPFLPFVTEEVWSWWRDGSVHRAAWPTEAEIAEALGGALDPAASDASVHASEVTAVIRRERSLQEAGLRRPGHGAAVAGRGSLRTGPRSRGTCWPATTPARRSVAFGDDFARRVRSVSPDRMGVLTRRGVSRPRRACARRGSCAPDITTRRDRAGRSARAAACFWRRALRRGRPGRRARDVSPGRRQHQVSAGRADGATCAAGARLADDRRAPRGILAAERTALNFLQHLSGIATLTRRFVDAARRPHDDPRHAQDDADACARWRSTPSGAAAAPIIASACTTAC